jgi:hypothetical protein
MQLSLTKKELKKRIESVILHGQVLEMFKEIAEKTNTDNVAIATTRRIYDKNHF